MMNEAENLSIIIELFEMRKNLLLQQNITFIFKDNTQAKWRKSKMNGGYLL